MILNIDGSRIGNPSTSGFRGLIRKSDGAWEHSFAGNIGLSNILHAELLTVYHGLVLAWELDIKELWCYSDSKIVIKLLSDHGNTCADFLAKFGARNPEAYSPIAV
ncbi:ribonuclease H, partial [Trifolium pratense]